MRRRRRGLLAALPLCAALIAAGATWAEDASDAAEFAPSPQLRALLEAVADDGEPIVSAEDASYLAELPSGVRDLVEAVVADGRITAPSHLRGLLGLRLSSTKLESALEDNCLLCHSDPELHDGDTLLTWGEGSEATLDHMQLNLYAADVHFRRNLSCAGCHGGDPEDDFGHDFVDTWPSSSAKERREDRSWVPGFCGRCHADRTFIRRFDPVLPTDQLDEYAESQHGRLLEEGDSRAAECTSCHGLHGIQGASSPRSLVYPTRLPETCGVCHSDSALMAGFTLDDGSPLPTDQLERYREGVHGRALLERGDLGAPVCNDCHGNHGAMPPEVTSVSQVCRNCHANPGTLFDESPHKEAFEEHAWPECGTCHRNHGITEPSEDMLAAGPDSICSGCHDQYARDRVATASVVELFHQELTTLAAAQAQLERQAEELTDRGIDSDAIVAQLDLLLESLRTARSQLHAFDRSEVVEAAAPGHEAIERLEELIAEAEFELGVRFRGLLVAGFFIGVTIIALWLKLRELESR